MKTTPDYNTLPKFYQRYVSYVSDLEMMDALHQSHGEFMKLLNQVPEDMGTYRYEEGKWSIKELICHMLDAERIFAYRALRFARNDKTNLPGFEENDYAPEANAHARTLEQLGVEAGNLRKTTLDLFAGFTPEMLARTGTANNNEVSVINLGYIIAGHETHHRTILNERYLRS